MALMYPDDIENKRSATDAEKVIFRVVERCATPHHDYICWYKPSLAGSDNMPAFILFGRKLGLVIIEIREWLLSDITAFTPNEISFYAKGKEWKLPNPDKEAKKFSDLLTEKLLEIPVFQSRARLNEKTLKLPISRVVVFINIESKEYHERGLQWLIPHERALFKNDIEHHIEGAVTSSGHSFIEKISSSAPSRFKSLTRREIEKLSFIISPESRVLIPERSGAGKTKFQGAVRILDNMQARLALRLGSGHQILKGPPGSGKTLVLVHRCCHLLEYQPGIKRILFVCYNIALVGYLKTLLAEKGVVVGEDGVQVVHFFEFCSKIIGESVHFENEGADYYNGITSRTQTLIDSGKSAIESFDALFVDEGQDFNNNMFRILLGLLNPGGDLVIALDSYQDLYKRGVSWKSLGIKASGRTHYLKRAYRNTIEIFDFSQKFIGEAHMKEIQKTLFPETLSFHGDSPDIRHFDNMDDIESFLVEDILESIEFAEYKRSEIAIVYDDKVYGSKQFSYDNRALPMRMLRKLESSGIPVTWVSQDVRAKEMFDVTDDRVSLISIHSSKGLDFDLVYLVGIDHIHPTTESYANLLTLVYVAITRAKYRLIVPYLEEAPYIKKMRDSMADSEMEYMRRVGDHVYTKA